MCFKMETDKIYNMDCIEGMKQIPDASVDTIIADPPFMISREATITRSRNPKKYKFVDKDISMMFGDWDVFETEDKFWEFTFKWMNEANRVLRKGGHFIIFFDKFKITPIIEWARKNGYIPRQPLYWIKTNPVPMAKKVSFMNAVSLIIWLTKGSTSRKYAKFHYELGQHKDYILAPICGGKERYEFGSHPTQKPLSVINWLMEYLTDKDDLVLDPFMGSGTTAVSAKSLGRHFIGFELEKKYYDIANNRLKKYMEQTNLAEVSNNGD